MGFLNARAGFSLVELIVSAVVFSLAAVVIVRLFGVTNKSVVQIHKDEKRAALLDYIEGRFKAVNYYDVFGVDSARKGGSSSYFGAIGVANNFWINSPQYSDFGSAYGGGRYGQYWANWNTSRMRQVLLDIDQRVAAEGYSRWVVRMTPAQRQTVLDQSTSSLATMAGLRFYSDSYSRDGIDDFNAAYRYKDSDGDGLYFSTFTDDRGRMQSEMPNMPIKVMEIILYKNGVPVNRYAYFTLNPGGLSGDEIGMGSGTLWATITMPSKGFVQYTSLTHDSIMLGNSNSSYSTGFFKNTSYTRYLRSDLIRVDLPDYSLNPPNTGGGFLKIPVKTTPGGYLVCAVSGDAQTLTKELIGVTGVGDYYLHNDYLNQVLMQEGDHYVYCYVERNGNTSPALGWTTKTDKTPPIATVLKPSVGVVHTRTPNVYAVLHDTSPTTAGRFGVELNSISMATMSDPNPTLLSQISYKNFLPREILLNYYTTYGNWSYVDNNGLTAVFIDTMTWWLPYIFQDGETVNMRVEYADAYYKAVSTWTFRVSLPEVDESSPTVTLISPLPDAIGVSPLAPIQFKVADPESGVNPYSLELVLNSTTVLSTAFGSRLGKSMSNFVDPTGVAGTGGFVVNFSTTTPFPSGLNTVTVKVNNWKDVPNDIADSSCTYTFSVP